MSATAVQGTTNSSSALVYVEADAANNVFEREDGSKSYSLSLIQSM